MVNAVTHILDNDSAVRAIVGLKSNSTTEYKVYPMVVFESEKAPYVVVRQSGKSPKGKNCGFDFTIDVIVYHNSYDDIQELVDACTDAITGQAAGTVNGVDYGYLNMVNEVDGEFLKEGLLYTRIITFEGVAG